jgi:hypothetical protein
MVMMVLVMVGSQVTLRCKGRTACLPAPPEAKSWSVERSAEPKKVAKRKGGRCVAPRSAAGVLVCCYLYPLHRWSMPPDSQSS